MTLPPDPYSDTSSTAPVPGPASSPAPARSVTDGMRQLAATALLAGNGVFLFLGVSNLLFVFGGWVGEFGLRSESEFLTFAGPVAIALPLLAMLLATHWAPAVPQTRLILQLALGEYAVSGFFGVITYLGAFAEGVFSVRSTFNGLLGRAVWLAFLTIASVAVYRVYRALYPPLPRYSYGPTVYGRPYPGQPTYPRPSNYTSAHPGEYPAAHPGEYPAAHSGDPAASMPERYDPTYPAAADATVRFTEPPAEPTRPIPPVPAPSAEPTPPAEPETASLPIQPAQPGDTAVPGATPER